MIVYFVRHASAGQPKSNPQQDARRPLDKEGVEQATQMGRVLASLAVQVDTIVSSPLKRATQTASLIANEIGHEGKLVFSPALAKGGSIEDFRQLLQKHEAQDAVMVVGHNPGLSRFLSHMLSAGSTDGSVDLKKGAVARVDVDARNRAVLKWCINPKVVRSVYETVASNSRPKTSRK
jgi:phosphohistidine phosphatase